MPVNTFRNDSNLTKVLNDPDVCDKALADMKLSCQDVIHAQATLIVNPVQLSNLTELIPDFENGELDLLAAVVKALEDGQAELENFEETFETEYVSPLEEQIRIIGQFLPPSVRRVVKGVSDLLLQHFSDILIFWKIF